MIVALTGASGFIGSYVLTQLLKKNCQIIILGRKPPAFLSTRNDLKFIKFDLSNSSYFDYNYIGKPDILIHLAWSGLPNYTSFHHYEFDLPSHYSFLKKILSTGLKNLFVCGTCAEYGSQNGLMKESMIPRPILPYSFAKNALRTQLNFLKNKLDFNFTWGRVFYLYGKGQSSSSLYHQLCMAVERRDKIFNMSQGEQIRDFLPVEKAAEIIVSLALMQKDSGIVNVCSGNPVSIKQQVLTWLDMNNWSIDLNLGYYPYSDYEAMNFWGSTSKLNKLTV